MIPCKKYEMGVWCSWLSHSLSMWEVPGSIPVSSNFFLFLLNSFFISFFSYNNNNETILCVPRSLDPKQKSDLVEAWIIVDPLLKKILYG